MGQIMAVKRKKATTYPWYPRIKAKATSAQRHLKKTRVQEGIQLRAQILVTQRVLGPNASPSKASKQSITTSSVAQSIKFGMTLRSAHRMRITTRRKRASSVKESTSMESSNWQSVIELYDFIEAQLHQFEWIRGCLMSEDHLELVINIPEEEALKILRQWVPQRLLLKKFMKLNYDKPPRMELVYGSESTILRTIETDLALPPEYATVSLLGSLGSESYAFSVGHHVMEGASYAIYERHSIRLPHSYGHSPVQVSCINSIHTTNGEYATRKGYDIAVFHFPSAVSQDNNFEGVSVIVDRTECGPNREMAQHWMGKKVQVLGNFKHKTQKATVKKVIGVRVTRKSLVFSAFQIEGDKFWKGQSGSLVTTVPDPGSNNVRAFAFLGARDPDNKHVGYALHLWENLSKVCEDHSELDIKNMIFESQSKADSGISSASLL